MVLRLVGCGQDARRNISPSTIVERLLLAPEKVGVGVLVQMRSDLRGYAISDSIAKHAKETYEIVGERRNLFETRNRNVRNALVLALLKEGMVHLTSTQDMPLDLFGSDQFFGMGIGEVPLEVGLASHLGKIGPGFGVTEERF